MRVILLAASALTLAGCGGEKYPLPVAQAFATLASVGTPPELYPLPVGVDGVDVNFGSDPADYSVKWSFAHAGEDLATIVARVEPSGDSSSTVTVNYVEGSAPDGNWHNGHVRDLLERHVRQLVVEAVDARFEQRPFDARLRDSIAAISASQSVGAMMKDVDASLDAEIERRKPRERESAARLKRYRHEIRNRPATNTGGAAKPMTDLSQYR
jgi:hypothetical protein